jgi:hypothetical protein
VTRAKISEYSATANDNTDVNGINIAENCPPSSMNNMGREIMAALKRFQTGSDGDGVTVGGSLVVSGSTTVNTFNVDVISEKTSAAGVTIDGVLLKDNGVVTGAGTVSAPVYSTTGDTNTGIFFPAADQVAVATNGVERVNLGNSATVFNDGGGDVDFRVEGDTEANLLFVDASADAVGIGTSTPTGGKLQVNHSASEPGVYILEDNSGLELHGIANFGGKIASNAITFNTGSGRPERARITSGGQFLIGTTTAVNDGFLNVRCNANTFTPISVSSTVSAPNSYIIRFVNNSGTDVGAVVMNATNNGVAYSNFSDYRLKENVAPMTGALAKVLELNPVTFTWKDGGTAGQGFIAHELQAVCPDAVTGEKDDTTIRQVEVSPAVPATYDDEGNELTPAVEAVYEEREVPKYQGVDTSFLVATLTAAIQELKAINDAQAQRIETLEAKVSALEAK